MSHGFRNWCSRCIWTECVSRWEKNVFPHLPPDHLVLYLIWKWQSRGRCEGGKGDKKERRTRSLTLSTTQDDRDCLWDCRWKIFSSIVPVAINLYTKQSFFWPSRHTLAKACWSAAGFQSTIRSRPPHSSKEKSAFVNNECGQKIG